MKISLKAKKYIIIIVIATVILAIIISIYNSNIEKETHIDTRDINCNGKVIKSIEYNIETKECFEVEISSCQKPTFKTINECKKLNGLEYDAEVNEIETNDAEINEIETNDAEVNEIETNDAEVNEIETNDAEVNDNNNNTDTLKDFFNK